MAYKLTTDNFDTSGEANAGKSVAALNYFAALTPPVTETLMRTSLETGQFQPFTDAAWNALLRDLSSLSIDASALTAAERSVLNTIYEVVSPPPQKGCCGIGGSVTPSIGDGYTDIAGFYRTGSTAPYQYEIQMVLNKILTCDIDTIEVTYTPSGGAPAVTSANPATLYANGCNLSEEAVFNDLWFTTATDPAGFFYDLSLTYKDKDGLVITTYIPVYQLGL